MFINYLTFTYQPFTFSRSKRPFFGLNRHRLHHLLLGQSNDLEVHASFESEWSQYVFKKKVMRASD